MEAPLSLYNPRSGGTSVCSCCQFNTTSWIEVMDGLQGSAAPCCRVLAGNFFFKVFTKWLVIIQNFKKKLFQPMRLYFRNKTRMTCSESKNGHYNVVVKGQDI